MKSPHTISVYQHIYEESELIEERLLSISRYNKDGKVLQREQYDDEGNLVKKEEYQYQGELVILSEEEDLIEMRKNKTTYEFQDDKVVKQKEYYNDELSIEMAFSYNEKGQLIKHEILNSDGSPNSLYTYEYQDDTTTERFFDEEMTLVRLTETVKNGEGQTIEKRITEIYDDRKVVKVQKIEYVVEDGESTKIYHDNGVEAYEVTECFDEKGRVIEKVSFEVAKDEEIVATMEYDELDNVTKEEITLDEEVVSVTNVTFDKYGNRTKLIKYAKLAEDFFDTSTYKFINEYAQEE